MANPSKTISISGWDGSNGRTLALNVKQTDQDPIANTSTVTWTASASGDGQYYDTYLKCNVGGSSVFNETKGWGTAEFPAADGSTSGTKTINHNSNGTGSVSFSIEGYVFTYSALSDSGTLTLDTIDRSGPGVTLSIDNVSEKGFRINIGASANCDLFEYSLDNGSTWNTLSGSGTSKSSTLTGLLTNHSYTVKARARRSYNHVKGTSAAVTVKTLGPSVITSIADMDIGSACSLSWVPHGNDFKFKVKFESSIHTYTTDFITPGIEGSTYTYTGYTFPMNLCDQLPNAVDTNMTVTLYSYDSSGTSLGSADSKTVKLKVPASVVPTITVTSGEDIGQSAFPDVMQNASIFHIVFAVAGAYSSTPSSVRVWYGNQSWSVVPVNGTAEITTESITASGEMAAGYEVTDSRGRKAGDSWTENVKPYQFPVITEASLEYTTTTVTLKAAGQISPVNNTNAKHLSITRVDLFDDSEVVIADYDLTAYSFSDTWTDSPEKMKTHNYRYDIRLTDSVRTELVPVTIHPGKLYRFEELDESKYYVGMDEEGWKLEGITGRVEGDQIIVEREDDGDAPAGIGFPVKMKENTAYELIYGGEIDDETYVFLSFFDAEMNYISSYDYERFIPIGTNVVSPIGATWAILILGRKGAGTKVFSNISLKEYMDPVEEEIEWFLETGNLGLDTPYQKYISRIQLRIDYSGSLKIEIAYDNEPEYKVVHESECDYMRSITVPIKVKRNDHFRIRLSGVGQMRMYSFGYSTDEGGARCLI